MTERPLCSILIVDDATANIDILVETLKADYDIRVAMDGPSALKAVRLQIPDLILLDIMMPGMDGYSVLERIRADERTRAIPVIFLTALSRAINESRGLAMGAVDYVTKPFNPDLVKARVKNQLELKKYRDQLESTVQERTRELSLTRDVVIEAMGALAEYRDQETGGHITRTQHYVRLLAQYLGGQPKYRKTLDPGTVELLWKSAPLHDVGKVGVRDSILLKPGKLTPEEFESMKQHVIFGRDAIATAEKKLGKNSFLRYARIIAETHHEKWDGTGYPAGLAGEDIPLAGRIMAMADVYDALVSKRCYKEEISHQKAVDIICRERGRHFDPELVDAFLSLQDAFYQVSLEFSDNQT